ncbi:12635_t:CDS:2, partial [Racocetra fulgida]
QTIRTQGVFALYRGLSALVIGTAAKAGVRFFTYDQIKSLLEDKNGQVSGPRSMLGAGMVEATFVVTPTETIKYEFQKYSSPGQPLPWAVTFGIGSIAGIVTVYSTMPLDVVKTKMQGLKAKELYKNSFHCGWKVLTEEGVAAFWKGATPRLGRLL